MPNVALIEELKDEYELFYIGTNGIEKKLIAPLKIPFSTIECPKLIRGKILPNLSIPARFLKAEKAARRELEIIRPDLVFSKGGFVALPVVFAAARLKIPAVTHESDLSLGLANRLMAKKCAYVFSSFPEVAAALKNGRYTGSPMRKALFDKNRTLALKKYGFSGKKPVLLVLGGGSGSAVINRELRKNLFSLLKTYDILHLCGRGNAIESRVMGYVQIEYEPNMGAAYACADGVVARAGSNTVFEVAALGKPALFIPLQNARSRGDQVKNAEYFSTRDLCHILYERNLDDLPQAIEELFHDEKLKKKIAASNIQSGNRRIINYIRKLL